MNGRRKGERRYWGERRDYKYTAYSPERRKISRRCLDRRNLKFEKE